MVCRMHLLVVRLAGQTHNITLDVFISLGSYTMVELLVRSRPAAI